ncbi:MAG TPA: hypothetical protein VE912_15985 [Bacteroidales bacterium]|nr:hypothetical protein [Bacteroidales bacterium]
MKKPLICSFFLMIFPAFADLCPSLGQQEIQTPEKHPLSLSFLYTGDFFIYGVNTHGAQPLAELFGDMQTAF